jgi:predicted porin
MRIKLALSQVSVALSGLMFVVGAHAQSSVTLYGLVDGGVLYLSKTQNSTGGNGGKLFGFTDSGQVPSQFGVRGTEDLGGGLSAEFKLESGISIANGGFNDSNGNFFGRQASDWRARSVRSRPVCSSLRSSTPCSHSILSACRTSAAAC